MILFLSAPIDKIHKNGEHTITRLQLYRYRLYPDKKNTLTLSAKMQCRTIHKMITVLLKTKIVTRLYFEDKYYLVDGYGKPFQFE